MESGSAAKAEVCSRGGGSRRDAVRGRGRQGEGGTPSLSDYEGWGSVVSSQRGPGQLRRSKKIWCILSGERKIQSVYW